MYLRHQKCHIGQFPGNIAKKEKTQVGSQSDLKISQYTSTTIQLETFCANDPC